jgi:hypothetical protein
MEAHDECHVMSTLAPGMETPQYSLNRQQGQYQRQSGCFSEDKTVLGIDPCFIGNQAHSPITILTQLSQFHFYM